jgi:hypothetical protein
MSLVLSQNTDASIKDLAGLHLKWTNTIEATIDDFQLFYLDNVTQESTFIILNTSALTADVTGLIQGRQYTFWLVAIDEEGLDYESNLFSPSFPFALGAPTIVSTAGVDNGFMVTVTNPTLSAGETLTGSPLMKFVLLKVSKGLDRVPFIVSKPYGATSFTLTSADSNKIQNDNLYKVSCYVKPDRTDEKHNTQSTISNTVTAQPSDLPAKPLVYFAGYNEPDGTADGSWTVAWNEPEDKPLWSQTNNVMVKVSIYIKGVNDATYPEPIVLDNPQMLRYTFGAMARQGWMVQIRYTNDRGDGALSDVITFFNYTKPSAVTNLEARVVPGDRKRIYLDLTLPLTLKRYPNSGNMIVKIQKNGGAITTLLYSPESSHFEYVIPDADAGASFSYTVYQTTSYANDTSITLIGEEATISVVYYMTPAELSNTSAVGGDSNMVVSWTSALTPVDGNNHSANSAKIVVTAPNNFSLTLEKDGGSATIPELTNGRNYTVKLYNKVVSPLGTVLFSPIGVTIENVIPRGAPPPPTGITATVGDGSVTVAWNETVGQVVNGSTITGFDVLIQGGSPLFTNVTSPYTITGLPNGVAHTLFVRSKAGSILGALPPVIWFTPFGNPIVSNIQFSGKTVSFNLSPNGSKLAGYEIIGLTAVPRVGDQMVIQSPVNTSGFSADITGTYPLSFTFTGASANITSAIIIIRTDLGTTVASRGLPA